MSNTNFVKKIIICLVLLTPTAFLQMTSQLFHISDISLKKWLDMDKIICCFPSATRVTSVKSAASLSSLHYYITQHIYCWYNHLWRIKSKKFKCYIIPYPLYCKLPFHSNVVTIHNSIRLKTSIPINTIPFKQPFVTKYQ